MMSTMVFRCLFRLTSILVVPLGTAKAMMPRLVAEEPICAQVRIQIDQSAILTRTAFKATLTVTNTTNSPLEQFHVNIDVRDGTGAPANSKFDGLDGAFTITGFTIPGVNGTGVIPASVGGQPSIGVAEWLIIPKDTATFNSSPQRYTVGGVVTHTQIGVPVAIPLFPVPIDVYPDAKLFLKYYLQSPVYGDSPFTPLIEVPEPFSLALIVRNEGFGAARNFRITSGQPYIIDNKQGLLVNFQILEAQLGLQPATSSLTLDFGDLAPSGSAFGRWKMTSGLNGYFSNYDVTFTHVNPLGGTSVLSAETSLIGGTNIFELDHIVQLTGPGQDDLPDLLVHNPPQTQPLTGPNCDPQSISDAPPRQIHLSDGVTVLPLAAIEGAMFSGAPTPLNIVVQMTVNCVEPGYNLIRVGDPGQGTYKLRTVRRMTSTNRQRAIPVGAPGDICNAWTTSRWVPFNCSTPTLQHRIHVLDRLDAPGAYMYELTYEADLRVLAVRVNRYDDGAPTRSNLTDVSVTFTGAINAAQITEANAWNQAVAVAVRLPGGAYQYANLPQSAYIWNPQSNELIVDLTRDAAGPDRRTRLREGNFELQIRPDLVRTVLTGTPLQDDDAVPTDGLYRYGTVADHGFFRLIGDVNGDRVVNTADANIVNAALGSFPGQPNWNVNADVIVNALINGRDVLAVLRQVSNNATLPFQ